MQFTLGFLREASLCHYIARTGMSAYDAHTYED